MTSFKKTVYISITGLELKAFWHYPTFCYHAVKSFSQSSSSPGNISTDAKQIGSVHHTLTVWESRADMVNFLRKGAHADAMKVFDGIATGKVYGYESDVIPNWEEAREIWDTKGRVVGQARRDGKQKVRDEVTGVL
jgi:hypothetical protein